MVRPLDSTAAARRFHTTRWSLVAAAAASTPQTHAALAELCTLYWPPVYAFARRTGGAEDARDLTQSFFAHLLEHHDLARVDRRRGRFRSWLLTAFQHFLANEWRRVRAQKRGGGAIPLSLDALDAEDRHAHVAGDTVTPELLYDRRWALTLLHHVMAKLESEQARQGKHAWFQRLQPHMVGEEPSYDALAGELRVAAGTLRVQVHRLRRRFHDLLRAEIADTVEAPEQVDDELQNLLAALM